MAKKPLSPSVAKRLMGFFATPHPALPAPTFPELTERERGVLELLAQGYTNVAIAQRLFLSPKAARNYVSRIFGKLQVADRTEAIMRARQAGLGRDGS
jgi:DNA-binding NarL/FixJ family response regulator